jgi:hypothetical protein
VNTVVELLRLVGLLGFVLFAAAYHVVTMGSWRRWPTGRWLMTLACVPVLFLALAVVTQWLGPDWPGRRAAQVVVYSTLVVLPYWLLTLLWRAQRRARREGGPRA